MNIHEYQAKQLLAQRGVPVPPGRVVSTPDDARYAARDLMQQGHRRVVVKSQIHAGGRGKGRFTSGLQGGIHLSGSSQSVHRLASAMLGQTLVTRQTGAEGRPVRHLLIEAASPIEREFYAAVLLDRSTSRPMVMVSEAGGMDIEEVARTSPDKILREAIDPLAGMQAYQARRLALGLGMRGELLNSVARLLLDLHRTWVECDASLVEINPLALVRTPAGKVAPVALDAKISLDDNALFRHPDLVRLRDFEEESPLELEAGDYGLNYIKLDGTIACLVNGAGLAMATMDIIQHYGGRPANFLDVGGGASAEQVTAAFRIILQDTGVRAILVNIFGGIMDCDVIAQGVVEAARETHMDLPLVVRLEGNNVESGNRTLSQSGLSIVRGDTMADAARKVVELAAQAAPNPR